MTFSPTSEGGVPFSNNSYAISPPLLPSIPPKMVPIGGKTKLPTAPPIAKPSALYPASLTLFLLKSNLISLNLPVSSNVEKSSKLNRNSRSVPRIGILVAAFKANLIPAPIPLRPAPATLAVVVTTFAPVVKAVPVPFTSADAPLKEIFAIVAIALGVNFAILAIPLIRGAEIFAQEVKNFLTPEVGPNFANLAVFPPNILSLCLKTPIRVLTILNCFTSVLISLPFTNWRDPLVA